MQRLKSRPDDAAHAVNALAALAQETRLSIFRLLIEFAPTGLTPGAIGLQLELAPATLSFHLKELAGAGLDRRPPRRPLHLVPGRRRRDEFAGRLSHRKLLPRHGQRRLRTGLRARGLRTLRQTQKGKP